MSLATEAGGLISRPRKDRFSPKTTKLKQPPTERRSGRQLKNDGQNNPPL